MMAQSAAGRILRVIEEFRKLDAEMQAQTMLIFVKVASSPGITMRDLEKWTDLASSSISRNVAALSKHHRMNKPGHDLVVARESPEDRRIKQVFLTAKGKAVWSSLEAAV